MPKARAIKPKPQPPEHRYMVKVKLKAGSIRTRFIYSTSEEDAREQALKMIDAATVHSCEQRDLDLGQAA